jgi:hypothetical protein
MKRSLLALSIAAALAGCSPSKSPQPAVQAERIDPVLAGRAQVLLGISLPCTLLTAVSYLDGGAAGGTLRGARGELLKFAFGPTGTKPTQPPDTTSKQYQAFVGADYPTKPGATPLGVGTPAESVLIDVLRTAVLRERRGATTPTQNPSAATAAGVITILERQRSHPRP